MSAVDDVRERTDILDLVGQHTQLRKAGRMFKGLCPFHEERTPSFVVYPDTGRWHCFGACASGGDVFSFVMRRDGVTFREALETLAHRAGVILESPTPQAEAQKEQRDRWRLALAQAAGFYHEQLLRRPAGEQARAYLRERRFHRDAAQAFELGWAPEGWTTTRDALRAAGFSDEELLAAGLVKRREGGGVYDAFRSRLVFPIRDTLGRTVGFGARTLVPGEVPKYVNSPQSELFDKSRLLYGLDKAKSAIHAAGRAVVVEGYTDVIRAHMAGFGNVVASLGTALTETHVRTLCRYTRSIVLALDADAAGQAATLRGLNVAASSAGDVAPVVGADGWIRYEQVADVRLHVAVLPEGQDPDDVVRDQPELWRSLVDGALPMMAYLFDTLTAGLDLTRPDDKTTAVERLGPIIAAVGDPVAGAAWLEELAQRTGIDRRAIATRARQLAESRPAQAHHQRAPDAAQAADVPRDAAMWLLAQLVVEPARLIVVNRRLGAANVPPLGPYDWPRGIDRALFSAVEAASAQGPAPEAADGCRLPMLPEELAEHELALRLRARSEPELRDAEEASALEAAVLRIREAAARQALTGVKALIESSDPADKPALEARSRELTAELLRLQRRLHGASGKGVTDARRR